MTDPTPLLEVPPQLTGLGPVAGAVVGLVALLIHIWINLPLWHARRFDNIVDREQARLRADKAIDDVTGHREARARRQDAPARTSADRPRRRRRSHRRPHRPRPH
jgi:hypothetical protein